MPLDIHASANLIQSIIDTILDIVQQAIDSKTSTSIINVLSLLLRAPLDFLTKTVRNAAIKRAYEVDAGGISPESGRRLTNSEQALLRQFMVKVIKDTEHVGPLVSPLCDVGEEKS